MPDNAAQLERQNAALTRQLLEWIAAAPRTYDDALETWRSSCPRHTIWEDALEAGLVEIADGRVTVSEAGRALLRG
jgi:predicted transcriptional regulator